MVSVGVLVRFEAKPDKVDEVEALLRALVAQVQREESTIAWFGFRLGPDDVRCVPRICRRGRPRSSPGGGRRGDES